MAAEGAALMQTDHSPRGGGGAVMAKRVGRRSGEAKAAVIAQRIRKEQLRSGKPVRAGATRRRFDAQHKTGGGGRPALMASQQVERTAELQDSEVRADFDWHVRGCERECSTGGRLGSIPQASARARQQATREQVESQWCESRTGTTRKRWNPAWRSYRRLRGCADRVSAAHAREQWRLSREQENPEVRGGVGIANQSGSIVSSQGSTTSNSSYPSLIAQLTTVTTGHREKYFSGHLSPTTIPWQASSSPTEHRHR
jgi:hypothetical protein